MRYGVRRSSAGFAILALLVLAGCWALGRVPRVSDVWPIDLTRPGGILVDRQLVDLRDDAELCRGILLAPQIQARPLADATPRSGCGWRNAVEASAVGGARLAVKPLTCEVAVGVAFWMEHVVQPAAVSILGTRVASVEHLRSYACRNVRGSPAFADRPSEHAFANALDIKGFRLADGRRVAIAADWGRNSAEGRFLAAAHAGACRYFRVAIGPDYNAAHRDHFHFDRGPWRACR